MFKFNIGKDVNWNVLGPFKAWGEWFVTPFKANAESTTSLPPEYMPIPVLAHNMSLIIR